MNILSIQSSVTRGHVGNSVAVMALQCLGHDAWPIDTVTFSNHPGHGGFRGRVTDAALIGELVQGLIEQGGLGSCDAVLSGYLGALDQGPALIAAVAAARAANPNTLFVLDPVIGDGGPQGGRVYVKPGIAEFLRDQAMPQADIATPNAFELEFLTGLRARDTISALAAMDRLRARMGGSTRPGGALVVATGMVLDDRPDKTLSILGADAGGAWRIGHPAIDHPAYGAGDLFAALLLGRLLNGEGPGDAAAGAAGAVHHVIERTAVDGNKDLRIVPNRRELVMPSQCFAIERIR